VTVREAKEPYGRPQARRNKGPEAKERTVGRGFERGHGRWGSDTATGGASASAITQSAASLIQFCGVSRLEGAVASRELSDQPKLQARSGVLTPRSQRGGQGFESRLVHHLLAEFR
jgi:hypothetical protein